jgi:hypothetical protein
MVVHLSPESPCAEDNHAQAVRTGNCAIVGGPSALRW